MPNKEGGVTAPQGTAISGNIKLVQILLERDADVNATPARLEGRTALEGAAKHGHTDIVQLLVNVGAIVDGSRAVELATRRGHRTVAQLLIRHLP